MALWMTFGNGNRAAVQTFASKSSNLCGKMVGDRGDALFDDGATISVLRFELYRFLVQLQRTC
nr:hypothetical protein Iba_chr13bCG13390 [Ipomoea batatas]GMD81197.1 hypothetical protein Iba_chr13eCG9260 [Ipomoea batatas]